MDNIPICRACLKTSLTYIDFETPFEQCKSPGLPLEMLPNSFTTYLDCFRACTHLGAAEREEEMPQSICEECGLELTIAWNFLQKALHADKILKDTARKVNSQAELHIEQAETDEIGLDGVDIAPSMKAEYCRERNSYKNNGSQKEKSGIRVSVNGASVKNSKEDDKALSNEVAMVFCAVCNIYFTSDSKHNHVGASIDFSITNMHEEALFNTNIDSNTQKLNIADCAAPPKSSLIKVLEADEIILLDLLDNAINNEHRNKTNIERNGDIGNFLNEKITQNTIVKRSLSNGSTFKCHICIQSFKTRRALLQHSRIHKVNGESVIVCKICKQAIYKKVTMRKHLQNAHSTNIQCSQCEYRCKEFKMPDHIRHIHSELTNFACNICLKTFTSQNVLNSHLKYHQRKEANIKSDACKICSKQFSTQHYLRLHMEVHLKERQLHKCDYCDKIYVSKIALENHIRLHKGETIKCEKCGKQFVRQYELNVHMRFHTRDYPFKCEVCGKKFAIKGHLRTHMWRHQGLKLQCEECGKLFTSSKALQEHSFVHSEMPFPCGYCGRGYPSKQKFKVHLRATHLIELTEEELQKVTKCQTPKPLQRKKLTLVQADSVLKEIEVKDSGGETADEDTLVELC